MIPNAVKKLLARLGRRIEGRSYKPFFIEKMTDFDNKLAELFQAGPDSDFIAFCDGVLKKYPVAVNLVDVAARYVDCLDDALVVFSGFNADELGDSAADVIELKQYELGSGLWFALEPDEERVSDLIARKCYDAVIRAGADELNTERLTLCFGLYCYSAAFCIPSFDAKSFRRLFVLAWFKYFSTVLTLENNAAPSGNGLIS